MSKPILALFSPNANQLTETFIKAHRELIDADIRLLYGGYCPQFSDKYGALVGQTWLSKALRRLERMVLPQNRLTSHEKAIVKFLVDEKVEVAMAEFGVTGAKVYKACAAAKVPLIVHFHGFDAHMYSTLKTYGNQYKKMFEYASYTIGVSQFMCNQLKKLGVPEEKLVYNPYGPNPAFFNCAPSQNSNNLVAIGRFIPKKAPELTVKAFAQIIGEYPNIRLRMGGTGESLEMCKKLAQSLGVADKIEFPGAINHIQVKEWFEDALAFVQHSVTAPDGDTEGTPVAVLEASAAGLPVVATNHAGIPDVIIQHKTGILVAEHDFDAYVNALRTIVSNPAHSRLMGQAGRANIRDHFTMERHISVLDDLIQKCIQI